MIDKKIKPQLFNDSYQNFKKYNIPKAQLILADVPFGIGENAYGSNPQWYNNGDNKNGESEFAKKSIFQFGLFVQTCRVYSLLYADAHERAKRSG